MTYNFDAERWYENQRAVLEHRRARGEITATEFEEQLERLGDRYDEMLERLNGPFELPAKPADRQREGPTGNGTQRRHRGHRP